MYLLTILVGIQAWINPNLGVWGGVILPPIWFSLNNSKMVKVVTLEFCNIQ